MKDYSKFNKGIKDKMVDNDLIIFDKMLKYEKGLDVYVNFSKEPIKAIINLKRKYTSKSEMEETIQAYSGLIKRGDYLTFKKRGETEYFTYIILSDVKQKEAFDEAVFVKCNQTLKFKMNNNIYEIPCTINNESYGVKILTSDMDGVSNSAKIKVMVQNNEISRMIIPDMRFMFSNSKYDIYQVGKIDFALRNNIVTFTCRICDYMQEDDVENRIAYQPILKESIKKDEEERREYKIIGQDNVIHKNTYKYYLEPICSDVLWCLSDIDKDLDMGRVTINDDFSCNLYVNEILSYDDTLTLIAKNSEGSILDSKNIIIKKK